MGFVLGAKRTAFVLFVRMPRGLILFLLYGLLRVSFTVSGSSVVFLARRTMLVSSAKIIKVDFDVILKI